MPLLPPDTRLLTEIEIGQSGGTVVFENSQTTESLPVPDYNQHAGFPIPPAIQLKCELVYELDNQILLAINKLEIGAMAGRA
ncbi:hypothetical protein G7046_g7629 [Stylonectria norvegica]|nr:hypothetical protein G7046_g7629 [Stylonectria norvegica]